MSSRRLALATGLAALSALVAGCPSISTMQTTATVPKGGIRFHVAPEAVGVITDAGTPVLPQFEFAMRYGLTDDLDLGAKIYIAGAEIGVKYQFLDGRFQMAIAPSLAFTVFSTSSGDESATVALIYIHAPILMGINIADRFEIGFGPKLMGSIFTGTVTSSGEGVTDSTATNAFWVGGYINLPIRVGDAFWIAPEFNFMGAVAGDGVTPYDGVLFQTGIGFYFGAAPNRGPEAPPPI